ncbi:hypothetical protein C8Q75DRAFT_890607 [Abortiporus biennis]|nr:hypothetical protein C8Q75DRAFT_890607 [Abortiporus biennis]
MRANTQYLLATLVVAASLVSAYSYDDIPYVVRRSPSDYELHARRNSGYGIQKRSGDLGLGLFNDFIQLAHTIDAQLNAPTGTTHSSVPVQTSTSTFSSSSTAATAVGYLHPVATSSATNSSSAAATPTSQGSTIATDATATPLSNDPAAAAPTDPTGPSAAAALAPSPTSGTDALPIVNGADANPAVVRRSDDSNLRKRSRLYRRGSTSTTSALPAAPASTLRKRDLIDLETRTDSTVVKRDHINRLSRREVTHELIRRQQTPRYAKRSNIWEGFGYY